MNQFSNGERMREQVGEHLASAAQILGINRAFKTWQSKRLLILCYHEVVPDELARDPLIGHTGVGVSEFKRQMAELKRLYHPIMPTELRYWCDGNGRLPRNPVLVTFDDGYRNNLTHAAPVLLKFGVPALVHVCAGYISQKRILWPVEIFWRVSCWPKPFLPLPDGGRDRPVLQNPEQRLALATHLREFCKRLTEEQRNEYLNRLREYNLPEPKEEICSFLSWTEVRELKQWGIEVGSHSVEHPILSRLSQHRLEFELKESRRIIEQQTGRECSFFAYPNGQPGDVSPTVIEAVRRAGYSFAFMVTDRLASSDNGAFTLDRVPIRGNISLADFRFRISGLRGVLKRSLRLIRSTSANSGTHITTS